MGRLLGSRRLAAELAAVLAVLAALAAGPAAADPRASTITQAEWNAESRRLELALRVDPDALERALEAYFGTPVALGDEAGDEKLERRLVRYLRDTFVVEPAGSDSPAELDWIGWQLESHRAAWLYFELPLPAGLDGASLSVRLFFEVEPRQLHVVRLRAGGGQVAHTLSRERPSVMLRTPSTRP